MKNLILILITLLLVTSTIAAQSFKSRFEYTEWMMDMTGKEETSYYKNNSERGIIIHTYQPDSILDKEHNVFFNDECIIITYNDRKDNPDFFPVTYKEYLDGKIVYYCYNGAVKEIKIVYFIKSNKYALAWTSPQGIGYCEVLFNRDDN
jgi:hypothetical protein